MTAAAHAEWPEHQTPHGHPAREAAARAKLAAQRDVRAGQHAGVPRRKDPTTAPLSPEQEGLWFIEQLGTSAGAYNFGQTVRLEGYLHLEGLQQALRDVVDRHEALRTRIVERDGRPVQLIAPPGDPAVRAELEVVDLRSCPPDELEDRAAQVAAELAVVPFELDRAPMLRAAVLRLADTDSVVLVSAHHLICDGQGLMLVVEELGACYDARVRGVRPALPELTVHFPDYAIWQRERLAGELGERQRAYWAEQLAGAPAVLELVTDRPRRAEQTFAGGRLSFKGDGKLAGRLKWFAAAQRCTAPMVLLTALSVVLTRYSGQTDIVIGMPIARRTRELQGAVGMFANTVALRIDTSGNPTVRELLARVRRVCMGAYENADLPFDEAAATVQRERSLSHNPLFQVMLVPSEAAYDAVSEPSMHGLRGSASSLDGANALVDLTWVANLDDLSTYVDYNTDLFDTSTIRQLGGHMKRLLLPMITDPDRRIWDLPMLTEPERAQLAALGSASRPMAGAPACVLESFVARAVEAPDATAVLSLETPTKALSYRELERRSRSVANRLVELGCGAEDRVALLLPDGIDAIVALLGVLRASAAYLPLDPSHPPARLERVLADSGARVLITGPSGAGLVPEFTGAVLRVPTADEAVAADDRCELPAVSASQLAYVIYTSGSTGEPKGVMVEHGNLRNLAEAFRDIHGFGPRQRLLTIPPLTFDASIGSLFPTLISGATLVLHPDPASLTGTELLRLCREHQITGVNGAAPLWQRWVADLGGRPQPDSPLSMVMVGGDRLPMDAIESWTAATGGTTALYHHYGPTEATVCATIYRVAEDALPDPAGYLPIGRPIPGVTAYVLDEAMRPAPLGVPGELYLGGAAPGRGYLGRPAETEERFVPDPFCTAPGARMYRTGDIARFRRDGQLEFIGRRDGQVKIRGYRVELAEVEAAVARHPGVREVAVVPQPDGSGLVAYVAASVDGAELRAFSVTQLPGYMVPSAFVAIDELPMTRHGKVDTAALRAAAEHVDRPYVPPSSDTERQLATIWSDVLDRERVGATDNFFELGGHSLLAATAMLRIRAEFAVSLPIRTLFETADLAELADVVDEAHGASVDGAAVGGGAEAAPDLRAEAVLPDDVCDSVGELDRRAALRPRHALLTGATGFLGGYLLVDLLTNTEATVHCLVRADSAEQAAARVRANLERYGLWRPSYGERIVGLPGDLAAPRLGLSHERFDALAGELDVIFHSGGTVNFVRPYRQLAPTNVGGTIEVLRLAGQDRATPVHLVSTLGVFLGAKHAGADVAETDPPDDPDGLDAGYDQSKWVSDALARQARERGLPVSIYRPARIAGDGRTGAGNTDDYFSRLIKTVVVLGTAPASDTVPVVDRHADLAPVDHVAAGIGALSRMPDALGRDFHFYNARTISLDVFTDTLRGFGYDIRDVPAEEWQQAVVSSDTPLAPFVSTADSSPSPARPRFDCRTTERLLADVGLVCPPADAELLRRYLDAFVEAGYLPPPR